MWAALAVVTAVLLIMIWSNTQVQQVDSAQTLSSAAVQQPNNVVQQFAQAIATADGFYVAGSIPQQANNPGDLELGDQGNGVLGEGITVFPDLTSGWNALYSQVSLMFNGTSHVYAPSM